MKRPVNLPIPTIKALHKVGIHCAITALSSNEQISRLSKTVTTTKYLLSQNPSLTE